jgi:outer membrane immunogenic protein
MRDSVVMKIFGLAAMALLGLVTAAQAADLPFKAPPTASDWSGWYAGVNAGGDWGRSQATSTISNSTTPIFVLPVAVAAFNALMPPTNYNTSGFIGGVQGGYNYQMGRWLVGLEGDLDYFRSAGSTAISGPGPGGAPAAFTASVRTDWQFTLRPRLGVVAGNWLLYATGGLAVTDVRANWSFAQPAAPAAESASASSLRAGWVVGAGVDTGFAGRYTLGLEYLHVDFGTVSTGSGVIVVGGVGPVTNPVNQTASLQADIVRLRVGKQF